MSEISGVNGDWQARNFGGVLPEGSKVKRLDIDTKSHVEYGEKTWTTGQTVRDILQNHLDANSQKYFDQLVATVIDTSKLQSLQLSESQLKDFDEFTYALFRYRKGLEDFSPEAEKEFQSLFEQQAKELPLKQDFRSPDGALNLEAVKTAITPIREIPPKILFKIIDKSTLNGESAGKWVTLEEFQASEYMDKTGENQASSTNISSDFRYQIQAVQILDEGTGFDSKLYTPYS